MPSRVHYSDPSRTTPLDLDAEVRPATKRAGPSGKPTSTGTLPTLDTLTITPPRPKKKNKNKDDDSESLPGLPPAPKAKTKKQATGGKKGSKQTETAVTEEVEEIMNGRGEKESSVGKDAGGTQGRKKADKTDKGAKVGKMGLGKKATGKGKGKAVVQSDDDEEDDTGDDQDWKEKGTEEGRSSEVDEEMDSKSKKKKANRILRELQATYAQLKWKDEHLKLLKEQRTVFVPPQYACENCFTRNLPCIVSINNNKARYSCFPCKTNTCRFPHVGLRGGGILHHTRSLMNSSPSATASAHISLISTQVNPDNTLYKYIQHRPLVVDDEDEGDVGLDDAAGVDSQDLARGGSWIGRVDRLMRQSERDLGEFMDLHATALSVPAGRAKEAGDGAESSEDGEQ